MKKIIVFDLDGTIIVEPEFYQKVYSGTLNQVIEREREKQGLEILKYCRESFNGKGELSLFMLNIPFREWGKELINAPLDLINPQPMLVEQLRKLRAEKVIYTGSPVEMAIRAIRRVGFSENDFDFVLGWEEPELFPIKWSCSSVIFKYILKRFSVVDPKEAWSVGDDWATDLKPAQAIGMKTAGISKRNGNPTFWFATLQQFLSYIGGEEHE